MTLLIFILFVSALIWKLYFIFMYYIYGIGESILSRENLCYIIWCIFKQKQINCEKYFYCVFITVMEITTQPSPLITIYRPFIRTFIYLTRLHFFQYSTGSFCWWDLMILHAFLNLHVWLILFNVLCLTSWEWPTNVTLVNVSDIISVSHLQG